MKNNLAIVIPAYKSTFLPAALDSIAAQTCKDFTLYIGDDCSPNNIGEIVSRYRDKINIVYKRFDTNLGGKDLVAQWERCIDMIQNEEWLWLFSDDDMMDKNCVEEFYKTVDANPDKGLFHFNVSYLDNNTNEIKELPCFPRYCEPKTYIDEKLKGHFISFVIEFVVHRDIFYSCGRFQNFDLAWGSDFISWIKFSAVADGIITCEKAKVIWRKSDENISPNKSNIIVYRKIKSLILNAKWIGDFAERNGYGNKFFYTKFPLGNIIRDKSFLSRKQKHELLDYYNDMIKPSMFCKFILIGLKVII